MYSGTADNYTDVGLDLSALNYHYTAWEYRGGNYSTAVKNLDMGVGVMEVSFSGLPHDMILLIFDLGLLLVSVFKRNLIIYLALISINAGLMVQSVSTENWFLGVTCVLLMIGSAVSIFTGRKSLG